MADDTKETLVDEVEPSSVDDWAVAFAAIDRKDEEAAEADTVSGGPSTGQADGDELQNAEGPDDGGSAPQIEGDDGGMSEDVAGGPGDLGGADREANEDLDWIGVDLSEEQISQYKESMASKIRERAIRDVANEYIKKGARHTNGRLGASINDPDICKRDQDGIPRFYNPETGREFSGDNPRRQAQEWVDDYNRELSEAFNNTCQGYEQRLMQHEGGRIAIIEFAPKYKALDPVRRSMFESIIEDYEVTDKDGNIIAYSCDLDKALAAVNRQVRVIKERFATKRQEKQEPSGPALDTPTTSPSTQKNGKPQFKSIEEAMEWEQDQLLAKMKGNR